jgi:hypothetical protein
MATADQKTDTTYQDFNSQALALAEQLGRIAGTVEGTAEAWLNRTALTDQLTKVRDGATQLLNSIGGSAADGIKTVRAQSGEVAATAVSTATRAATTATRAATTARTAAIGAVTSVAKTIVPGRRSKSKNAAGAKRATRPQAAAAADLAHAPGKSHRKPGPSVRGAKKSDSRIPKMKTAAAARRRRKSYA